MEIARTLGSDITWILRWTWPRKGGPVQQAQEPSDRMLEDLARLAELSPHLLSDIGFAPDPGSSSPAREVWRKEGLCIAVVRHDTGAEVQVEGLTD